ncbi:MAG: FAD-dependent oxidoreductase [Ignavibacteriales bacterium]|nr:MAG: FAD-dependent oxidoreductase [Ignavibacteriales bacterium]
MKRVIVVGGGFAGLSASVYLAENNFEVTLLEASPKLGGRAYSLYNQKFDDYYDNGQHILMGCYEETLSFLKKIDSTDNIEFQNSLRIPFLKKGGGVVELSSYKKFYPLSLFWGILNYKILSFRERLKVTDFFFDLMCCYSCDLKDKTVKDWLECKKQSENTIKSFWEILVVGTLNTTTEKASAEIFSEILQRIFLSGNKAATIVLPKTSLEKFYLENANRFIKSKKGKIILSERVDRIEVKNNKIFKIVTENKSYSDFDFGIMALPEYAAKKIMDNSNITLDLPEFEYSPILNVHLWLKENPFKEKFYGFIGSQIHWLFNHGRHISLTTSSAENLINLENSEIIRHFCSEIELYFPIFKIEMVIDSKVIKEKRATFIPDIASTEKRKNFNWQLENFLLAGDWTNTGLPATIESAVLSGKIAATQVISSLK